MKVTKCDLCKKEIKEQAVMAGVGFFDRTELCQNCGQPILKFLKRHKLLKEDKK